MNTMDIMITDGYGRAGARQVRRRSANVIDPRQAPMDGGAGSFVPMGTVGATAGMDHIDYNRCVEEHADGLYRFVVKHLRDRDDAKDIVQEAFLRLWVRLDMVRPVHAKGYLFTTAHNLVVDRSRRRKHVVRYDPWHEQVQVTHQPKAGLGEALDRALATLPPIQRTLVLLRDLEGHSYLEMAAITGLDMTKVKVYLFRARKALQEHIGDPAIVA